MIGEMQKLKAAITLTDQANGYQKFFLFADQCS